MRAHSYRRTHDIVIIAVFSILLFSSNASAYSVDPPVHQWIAGQALDLLPPGEMKDNLFLRIGPRQDITVGSHIVEGYSESYALILGAKDEDSPKTNLCWHFWNEDDGVTGYNGICTPPLATMNAYQAALEYWSMAKGSFLSGNRWNAFYVLGRVSHLLMDMSVPAHTHKDNHIPVLGGVPDSYETYMTEWNDDWSNQYNYHHWNSSSLQMIKRDSLETTFRDLNDIAQGFESNNKDGEFLDHRVNHAGALEPQDGFRLYYTVSYAECWNHGNRMMPYAMKFVAGLYISLRIIG